MSMVNASVVLAKCTSTSKLFGIRVQENENGWFPTWAFPINESAARREGYDQSTITVTLSPTPEYPGCPHCKASKFWKCSKCGKVVCLDWRGVAMSLTCAYCGEVISLVPGTNAARMDVSNSAM
ncbi:MAG: hypothetical protein LBT59_20450 [Clostridiales bacterium]|nr:hypothetical protein [Clostridiales bacterium]